MAPTAAFDFDGTLTRRDTMVPFLHRLAGTRALAAAFVATAPGMARCDRDAVKAGVVRRVVAGRRHDDVARLGESYATEILARRLRPDTLARLRWHQREGHRTVIVSASLRPYLEPVAGRLGIDHVICTELDTRNGVLTGEFLGGNCRGPAKAERLSAWLGADAGDVWAYGDSSGDDELLLLAKHGMRVR